MFQARSTLLAASLLAAALSSVGCASIVGTVAGPVTGPVTAWRHTAGMSAWARPIALPAAIMIGPLLGLLKGIGCDAGLFINGEYGANGYPPFELVFDPTSIELSCKASEDDSGQ